MVHGTLPNTSRATSVNIFGISRISKTRGKALAEAQLIASLPEARAHTLGSARPYAVA